MDHRPRPAKVVSAIIRGDKRALARYGRHGNRVMRQNKEALAEYLLRKHIHSSRLMSREAHEDICPVGD